MSRAFLDTNILVCAYLDESPKAPIANDRLRDRFAISVQSLNEFANAARRKFRWDWQKVDVALTDLRSLADSIVTNGIDIHLDGIVLAERYGFSVYDAMIVAAALHAGCDTLYSEDMHHGLAVEGRLTIVNPFRDLMP